MKPENIPEKLVRVRVRDGNTPQMYTGNPHRDAENLTLELLGQNPTYFHTYSISFIPEYFSVLVF